jgi:hypothetical protein
VADDVVLIEVNYPEDKDEWYGYLWKCGKCEETSIWYGFKYCPMCGITIKWVGEWVD